MIHPDSRWFGREIVSYDHVHSGRVENYGHVAQPEFTNWATEGTGFAHQYRINQI